MSVVLVTGANRGIGLEFCRQMAARGDDVIGTCRASSDALAALPVQVLDGVDVASDAACAALAGRLAGKRIDVLVLNAGVFDGPSLGALDFDRMRYTYDVDALGPLRVVQALLGHLSPDAKIVLVGSRAGSIGDNASGGNYGYRMAKAALGMAGVCLARDLAPRGIAVVVLHPGMVDTDMLRGGRTSLGERVRSPDIVSAATAVDGMLKRIDELTLETSGRFVHRNGRLLPW